MNQFNLDMLQVLNNYDLKNLEVQEQRAKKSLNSYVTIQKGKK